MQNFNIIDGDETLLDSLTKINDNDLANRTQNSGTAFPTVNLAVGMTCYREDLGKTFVLDAVNPPQWRLEGLDGGGSDRIFHTNERTITSNYVVQAQVNTATTGDIEIADGVDVDIADGGDWTMN